MLFKELRWWSGTAQAVTHDSGQLIYIVKGDELDTFRVWTWDKHMPSWNNKDYTRMELVQLACLLVSARSAAKSNEEWLPFVERWKDSW